LRGTNWETTIRVVAGAIVLVAPAIMLVRQVQRASIRGTAVQLPRIQFLDLYASVDEFAATMRVKLTQAVYLSNGNGTLNAFAAQSGWTNNYVVLSNELFANLRNDNQEETRFILGHEIGHIRLHHYVRGRPYGRLRDRCRDFIIRYQSFINYSSVVH
jgi:Zn-dependent protease with chaperone function